MADGAWISSLAHLHPLLYVMSTCRLKSTLQSFSFVFLCIFSFCSIHQIIKNLPAICGRSGFNSWVGKMPWRSKWQPTPVFLPGEFYGQRSLVGYSPWGRKQSDMTGRLNWTELTTVLQHVTAILIWYCSLCFWFWFQNDGPYHIKKHPVQIC